jgi:hypothetical protein
MMFDNALAKHIGFGLRTRFILLSISSASITKRKFGQFELRGDIEHWDSKKKIQ